MFHFERKKAKKRLCNIFTVFVRGYLSTAMFIFFLSRFLNCFFGKALANFLVAKCFILDVAGVLNPLQYAPIWINLPLFRSLPCKLCSICRTIKILCTANKELHLHNVVTENTKITDHNNNLVHLQYLGACYIKKISPQTNIGLKV